MTIEYRDKGKGRMSLFSNINKMLEFPSHFQQHGRISKTLAASHLFTTNDKCDILNEDKARLFHHRVANLMYICWRTRQAFRWPWLFYVLGSRDPTGMIISGSYKQKLNTKNSTAAELVVIDVAMGQILWTRHFLASSIYK